MLKTEMRNPNTMHIDRCGTEEILRLIQNENQVAVDAVGAAVGQIARACDAIEASIRAGGRLIYIGAGSSGRIGVLDAVECPPTYGVPRELVVGLIAGGYDCMFRAAEGAEDSAEAGVADLQKISLVREDAVVGISAAGNAGYVAAALGYARDVGCITIGITSNAGSRLDRESDIPIITDTGPEPITGSTRMEAGSAQKMVCNMLTTTVMTRLGMVYENLMINLKPTNLKLRRRVISIVCEILSCDETEAVRRLDACGWSIRAAVEADAAGDAADQPGADSTL